MNFLLGRRYVCRVFFLAAVILPAAARPALAQSNPAGASTLRQESLRDLQNFKAQLADSSGFRFRFDHTGYELRSALGFKTQSQLGQAPLAVARTFLSSHRKLFKWTEDTELSLATWHQSPESHHVLFYLKHKGIPVEFGKVSAHLTAQNEIHAVFSNWDSQIAGVNPVPTLTMEEAKKIVETQWKQPVSLQGIEGELVYLPKRFQQETRPIKEWTQAKAHLAWKFKFRLKQPYGLWSVYVEAHTGEIIGSINELKLGTAYVRHWDRDPAEGGAPDRSGLRGLYVYEGNITNPTIRISDVDGAIGDSAANALYAVLRATYASVVDDNGVNPIFAEGGANWQTVILSSASSSPYGASLSQEQDYNCGGNSTIFTQARFSQFDVGYVSSLGGEGSGASDDIDFAQVLQPTGKIPVASYLGQGKNAFWTNYSSGSALSLRLKSNKTDGAGAEGGYKVNRLQCLVQSGSTSSAFPNVTFFDADGVLVHHNAAAGNGHDRGYAMVIDASGRIIVAGESSNGNNPDMALWRFNADGSLDATFSDDGVYTYSGGNGDDAGRAVAIDASGRIVVAGYVVNSAGNYDLAVWRLTSTGLPDTSFDGDGIFTHAGAAGATNNNDQGFGLAIDASGRIVAVGRSVSAAGNYDLAVWRLTSSGVLDSAFDGDGHYISTNTAGGTLQDEAHAVAIDASGRIVVAGTSINALVNYDMVVLRLSASGVPDASFGNAGVVVYSHSGVAATDEGNAVAIDASGRIVVAGHITNSAFNFDLAVWRLTSSGALDSSFDGDGVFTHGGAAGATNGDDSANAVTIDSSNRLVIAGYSRNSSNNNDMTIWRLTSAGALDTAFDTDGYFFHNSPAGGVGTDVAHGIAIDSSGRILTAGRGPNSSSNDDLVLWQLQSSGGFNVVTGNILKHVEEVQRIISSGHKIQNVFSAQAPVIVHANFGDKLADAFFDTDTDAIYLGEGSSLNQDRNVGLATDVIMHEYGHWIQERVYTLSNFGQSGAVSEAVADFVSLDTFNTVYSSFSKTTFAEWAFPGGTCGLASASCRQLNNTKKYPDDWIGEIHYDGQILGGALWDLRTALGAQTARDLFRSAFFYFPDSFDSFYEAMLAASAGAYDSEITEAFDNHGIGAWPFAEGGQSADALEPNNGFANARSLVSGEQIKATIYPGGDVDVYRFVAGAGPVVITLSRPFDTNALLYLAYGLQVFDLNRQILAGDVPSSVFETPPPEKNAVIEDPDAQISLTLSTPKLLYVVVAAPYSSSGNNDHTNSPSLVYTLKSQFQAPADALSAAQVSATLADQRRLRMTAVDLTGFAVDQSTETSLDHVDVLDHAKKRLAQASSLTVGNGGVTGLTQIPGRIEATIVLPATFFTDYPAVGSIYLEPYVSNPILQQSLTSYSLGLSNEIKIFSDQANLKAYNNLFNPAKGQKATFKYESDQEGLYRLAVYTLAGDLVKILREGQEGIGMRSIDWDGKNGSGDTVASGVYLIHLEGPGIRKTSKAVVIK